MVQILLNSSNTQQSKHRVERIRKKKIKTISLCSKTQEILCSQKTNRLDDN